MLILETFEFFQFMVAGFMDNQFERNVFLELSELPAYCISELTKYIPMSYTNCPVSTKIIYSDSITGNFYLDLP